MGQSWLIWVTSTAAFVLTAVTIVVSGSLQEPAMGDQSFEELKGFDQSRLSQSSLGALGADYRNARADGFSINQATGDSIDNLSKDNVSEDSGSEDKERIAEAGKLDGKLEPKGAADAAFSASFSNASFSNTSFSKTIPPYQPIEKVTLAHPSNYGERFPVDIHGNAATNDYIVVLHETVGSASSALNTFQTNHPNDNDQVSYHTLIGLDGTVYYVVPPEQRAFGAGNSSFQTNFGEEAVFTNADFPSSVNNFAYHISLETPPDGQNNNYATHSGYTEAQYQSLAWLLARTTVPNDRITTHKAVDRSGSRSDPRSFDSQRLVNLLNQYPSRAGL